MSKKMLLLLSGFAIVMLILVVLLIRRGAEGSAKYGAPINPSEAQTIELGSLFSNIKVYEGKRVIVEGQVGQACQTSGCWLIMTDGANQLFVQFYEFTVRLRPGARVRVQGEVRIQNNAPYLVGQGLEVIK